MSCRRTLWAATFAATALAVAALAPCCFAQPASILAPSQLEPLPAAEGEAFEYSEAPPCDYFDLDEFIERTAGPTAINDDWAWRVLPSGIVYKGYLADPKESRIGTQVFVEDSAGTLWDSTLGGRAGLVRYGSDNMAWPIGWQLDIEGSGQVRLDPEHERDLDAADFRVGVPLTYGYGPHRVKFGYYHLSSHVGDEYMISHPGFDRFNFVRDALVLGYSLYWTDNVRTYAEMGWAFYSDISEEWEFRFGVEYAPALPTGFRGAPFAAIHGHLREELDYGGNLTVQAGWAWRGDRTSHLLRTGLHYYNGHSNEFSFYQLHEHQIGYGVWYDF